MNELLYEYDGAIYPDYIRRGNACQFIAPTALQFCKGEGLDIGCGKWPLPGAIPIDVKEGGDAMALPEGLYPFAFSSHCLEHLNDPIAALKHWKTRIQPGGVLFLYLPSHEMRYWLPQFCARHRHTWRPEDMAQIVKDLGFIDVLHGQRDLAWGFGVVGFVR